MSFFKSVRSKTSRLVDKLRSRSPTPSPGHSRSSSPQPPHVGGAVSNYQLASFAPPSPDESSNPVVTFEVIAPSRPPTPSLDTAPSSSGTPLTASSPVIVGSSYVESPAAPSVLSTTGSVVYEVLETVRDGSDLFLPLKAALVGVVKIWDVCERTGQVKEEFTKLNSKLARLKAIVSTYKHARELDDNLRQRLQEVANALQDLAVCVEAKLARGVTLRALQSKNDIADVADILNKISSLLEVFEFEGIVRTEIAISEIKQLLAAKDTIKASEVAIKLIADALGKHHVPGALHDAQPLDFGCMEGTRVQLLENTKNLITSRGGGHIVWITGMAGSGKTSIALTLCRELTKEPTILLGGTFFCSRSAGAIERMDAQRIIPTLAVVLARKIPTYAEALAEELKDDPDLAHKSIPVQIERLFAKQFPKLGSFDRQIVFIVDAMDECSDAEKLAELINALVGFDGTAAAPIKFLFTSRPEMHIRETPIADTSFSSIIHLQTIDQVRVTADIRLYIQKTFENRAMVCTDDDLDELAILSGGLFIFASTALAYIFKRKDAPSRSERLRTVKMQTPNSTLATASLDKMYTLVLTQATDSEVFEPTELDETRRIVAAILSTRTPLTLKCLAKILGLSSEHLRGALEGLHAVIFVPKEDDRGELRALHASFGDFIFTRAPELVRIPKEFGHNELARGCLKRMAEDDLCFNISRSATSYNANPQKKPDWIATSLIYACFHWAHHVDLASTGPSFNNEIESVFRNKLLFWLELLSIIGEIGRASGLLRIAASVVTTESVALFLRDANSFVTSSHEAIARSAAHIYLSALPFTHQNSLIRQTFSNWFTGLPLIETFGIDGHGGRCVMVLAGHEQIVTNIAYSPDGKVLASSAGFIGSTVCFWDTRSGTELRKPLTSPDGRVEGIVFTSDGHCLIAGTGAGSVLRWDLRNGRLLLQPHSQHDKNIRATAVSLDGRSIAYACSDGTIGLWSAETGELVCNLLHGNDTLVRAISFSPDGRTLAVGDSRGTVRLWNYFLNQPVGEPFRGHQSGVRGMAFSWDGELLASGSSDGVVHVWDTQTGHQLRSYSDHQDCVNSVAFAPDSRALASGSDDRTVRIWNLHEDSPPTSPLVLRGHSAGVNAVCFSNDGLNVASGSADRTIRVWDAGVNYSSVLSLDGHTDLVNAVAISGDSRLIASASEDCSARVWDAHTCEQMYPPVLEHAGPVRSVAFSSDSVWIATGSADMMVRLWDAQTGQLVMQELRGHTGDVYAVAFSPRALHLVSGSDDRTVRVWDLSFGLQGQPTQISPQMTCNYGVCSVAYSPDERFIGARDVHCNTSIFDATTGQLIQFFEGSGTWRIESLAFSPDSAYILAPADTDVIGFDIHTGNCVFDAHGHAGPVNAVAYSPNGQFIASSGYDLTVRLWDAETAEALEPVLHGHAHDVRSVTFSSDARLLATGGYDMTVRLWDLEKSRTLAAQRDRNALSSLAFARYEQGWLVSPTGDLLLWVPPEYRGRLEIGGHSRIIATHRVAVTAEERVLHQGEQWIRCWRADNSPHDPL